MTTPTPELPLWLDVLLCALLVIGVFFTFVGSWGLVKLSDFFMRLHGPTKATTLGVGSALIASALYFGFQGSWSAHELLITLFLFLTAPVSAHLLIQAVLANEPKHQPPLPGRK